MVAIVPLVHHVRALGDTEILKSYLLLIWSDWSTIWNLSGWDLTEVLVLVLEGFSKLGDLIEQADRVLARPEWG